MKKFFKFCFKYGGLVGYILLTLVLIVEAAMPGDVSASHSNTVGDIINEFVDIDFDKKHENVEPTKIEITNTNTSYYVGESIKISTDIAPSNASNKSVEYSVSDDTIAKIDASGKLTFIKEGSVTVNVKIKDKEITDSMEFSAVIKTADSIEILSTNESHLIEIGEIEQLSVKFNPTNTTYIDVVWESSDESVATIDANGKITPINVGHVTFTAHTNGLEASVSYEIVLFDPSHIRPTNVVVTHNDSNVGSTFDGVEQSIYQFSVSILPEDTTNKNVKWTSSDKSIATVSNGKITTLKNGTVKIEVVCLGDETVKYSFIMNISSVEPVFSIKNINDSNKLTPKTSVKLEIEEVIMPSVHTIKYESSDENVCKVNGDGTINTISEGNVTIKVICEYSDGEVEKTIDLIIENEKDTNKFRSFYLAIRKGIGHFGAFFVLAVMSSLVVIFFFKRKTLMFILSTVAGLFIAFLTELIQLFTPGRSGLLKDVGIDFAGFATGTALMVVGYLIFVLIRRKIKKHENK